MARWELPVLQFELRPDHSSPAAWSSGLLLARDRPLRFAFAGPVLLLLTLPGPAVPLVVVATPGMRPEDRRRTSAPAGGGGDANDAAMWTSSAPAATAGRLQDMAAGAVTRQVVLAETGPAA